MGEKNIDKKIRYNIYLLERLMQDVDNKIDNPPVSYDYFSEGLKIHQEYGIISQKHRGYNEND